jgi:hypothetical protein
MLSSQIIASDSLVSKSNLVLELFSIIVTSGRASGGAHLVRVILSHGEGRYGPIFLGLGPMEDILVLFRVRKLGRHYDKRYPVDSSDNVC